MEHVFKFLRCVDSHKAMMGEVYWKSWVLQESIIGFYKEAKTSLITQERCDDLAQWYIITVGIDGQTYCSLLACH